MKDNLILPSHLKAQTVNVKVTCSGAGYSVEIGYEPAMPKGRGHFSHQQKMASIIAMRIAALLRPEAIEKAQAAEAAQDDVPPSSIWDEGGQSE